MRGTGTTWVYRDFKTKGYLGCPNTSRTSLSDHLVFIRTVFLSVYLEGWTKYKKPLFRFRYFHFYMSLFCFGVVSLPCVLLSCVKLCNFSLSLATVDGLLLVIM